jgi:uncharacterized protein YlxW (UPF0749 family)
LSRAYSLVPALILYISPHFRRKIAAKLAETEEELAAALSKANSAEKAKQRLAGEVEDLNVELDKVRDMDLLNYDAILKSQCTIAYLRNLNLLKFCIRNSNS